MSNNQDIIKSQDDLNTCNDGKRGSEVLVATIEKCEALEKENKGLRKLLKECKANFIHRKQLLEKLEELEKPTTDILTRINAVIGESEE